MSRSWIETGKSFVPAHGILVLIAYASKHYSDIYAHQSSVNRGLFSSLSLHLFPYLICEKRRRLFYTRGHNYIISNTRTSKHLHSEYHHQGSVVCQQNTCFAMVILLPRPEPNGTHMRCDCQELNYLCEKFGIFRTIL